MNDFPHPDSMLETTRLTRAGRLAEATALLQRLLRGNAAPDRTGGATMESAAPMSTRFLSDESGRGTFYVPLSDNGMVLHLAGSLKRAHSQFRNITTIIEIVLIRTMGVLGRFTQTISLRPRKSLPRAD